MSSFTLLFLLVVEGMRKLIEKAKLDGRFRGVMILDIISITHLLFADDVLLFGRGYINEWVV